MFLPEHTFDSTGWIIGQVRGVYWKHQGKHQGKHQEELTVFGFGNRKKVLRMEITSFLTLMVILLAEHWKVVLLLAILAAIPGFLKKKQ